MRFAIAILLLIPTMSMAAPTEAPFKSVAEILSAPRREYSSHRRFNITGQLIRFGRSHDDIIVLRDETATIGLKNRISNLPEDLRAGDVVTISGSLETGRGMWLFANARELKKLGWRPLPPIMDTTGNALNDVGMEYALVRVRGVLTSVLTDETDPVWLWLTLHTKSGYAFAACHRDAHSIDEMRGLVDGELTITGMIAPFTGWRQSLGNYITIERIEVVKAPPADPFSAPQLDFKPSRNRHRTTGTILAAANRTLYLKTDDYPLLQVELTDDADADFAAGERVEAAGFVSNDPFTPTLTCALVRKYGNQTSVRFERKITAPNAKTLFVASNGTHRIDSSYNGKYIRLTGIVRTLPSDTSIVPIDCNGYSIDVETAALGGPEALSLEPGCTIEVSGLCLVRFERRNSDLAFPRFDSFTLVPSNAADVRIVARPPWWTPAKLLVVILILAVLTILTVIWNRALTLLSERRGRELARERIAHTRTEVKVEERTRLAVELHDSISQTLTGVALQVDSAIRAANGALPAADRFLSLARQMLSSCRKELQDCLWDLRSRTFEERDMTEAVEHTLAPHTGNARVDVRFNVPRRLLSETTAHAVLRIVRELTVNALRHGKATHVRVAGEFHDGTISFSVRDDGTGFDPEHVVGPSQGHFGLSGIRERLLDFGGELKIDSHPGAGSRFTVTMKTQQE